MATQLFAMFVILTPILGLVGLFTYVVVRWLRQSRVRMPKHPELHVLPGGRADGKADPTP